MVGFSVPMPLQIETAPSVKDFNFQMESFNGEWLMKNSFGFQDEGHNFIRAEELGDRNTADPAGKYGSPGLASLAPRKGRYYCTYNGCTKSFSRPTDRERHSKKHYPEERVFVCPEIPCTMRFYRRDKLVDHSRRMHRAGGRKHGYIS